MQKRLAQLPSIQTHAPWRRTFIQKNVPGRHRVLQPPCGRTLLNTTLFFIFNRSGKGHVYGGRGRLVSPVSVTTDAEPAAKVCRLLKPRLFSSNPRSRESTFASLFRFPSAHPLPLVSPKLFSNRPRSILPTAPSRSASPKTNSDDGSGLSGFVGAEASASH